MRGQWKNKRDANEPDVIAALKKLGFAVYPLNLPLDLLCGYQGMNYLVEVKNGPSATFTEGQEAFIATWTGQQVTVRSVAEAEAWARGIIAQKA